VQLVTALMALSSIALPRRWRRPVPPGETLPAFLPTRESVITFPAVLRAACALLLLACVSRPTAARADDAPASLLDLEWTVAEGCPDRQSARAAIEALLGAQPAGEQPPITVRVEISRLPSGQWQARISTPDRQVIGERVLKGASCELLVGATALIVAIALDPVATAERVAVRGQEPATPPPAPVPAAPTTPRPIASTPRTETDRTRIAAGLRAAGDLGSLPEPTLGVGFTLDLSHARALLRAEATAWLPRVALRGPVAGSGGEIGLYSGALRGCYDALQASGRRFRLGPCLAAEAGLSTGAGINLTHPARSSSPWVAALGGLLVRQRAQAVTLWALAEGGLAIRRPVFAIEGFQEPVFQASPVLGRISLGAAWFLL
jgi:hypothetical protein